MCEMKAPINYKLLILISILVVINLVYNNANSEDDTLQPIQLGQKIIQVEIADTQRKRNRGLMYRKSLPDDQGMLFVFPSSQILSFWMKNTYIPLSIGFFNSKRQLLEVQEMQPESVLLKEPSKTYKSRLPAKYALEMNKGWFSKNKIKLGTKFKYLKGNRSKSKSRSHQR